MVIPDRHRQNAHGRGCFLMAERCGGHLLCSPDGFSCRLSEPCARTDSSCSFHWAKFALITRILGSSWSYVGTYHLWLARTAKTYVVIPMFCAKQSMWYDSTEEEKDRTQSSRLEVSMMWGLVSENPWLRIHSYAGQHLNHSLQRLYLKYKGQNLNIPILLQSNMKIQHFLAVKYTA